MNYFGPTYVDLIGLDRLLSAPAAVDRVGEGVMVRLANHHWEWEAEDYQRVEQAVLDWLGREYFFAKAEEELTSSAPDWTPLA